MKKLLTIVVSMLLLLTVAGKSEAVEEAPVVEEAVIEDSAVKEVAPAVEEAAPAESVE